MVVWSGNMAETSKTSMELNDNNPSNSSSSGSEDSESERSGAVTSILERLRAPKLSELSQKCIVAANKCGGKWRTCYQFFSFISSGKEL